MKERFIVKDLDVEQYVVPEGVTNLWQVDKCNNLRSITLPASLESISDDEPFSNCPTLESIEVSLNNKYFRSIDGVLFSKDEKSLFSYPIGRQAECYIVPKGVEVIKSTAFMKCATLRRIVLPESVSIIENSAFGFCTSLTSFDLPRGLKEIKPYAISHCESLKQIIIPNGVEIIDDSAFYGCYSLSKVVISQSVKEIRQYAFSDCNSLRQVIIQNGVEKIMEGAFIGCNSLEIFIPPSVNEIDVEAFSRDNITIIGTPGSRAHEVALICRFRFLDITSLQGDNSLQRNYRRNPAPPPQGLVDILKNLFR